MSAKLRCSRTAALALSAFLTGQAVLACHTCKQTPCAMASPAPAYKCVTEMVPFTVMKTKTRVDLVPSCTRTLMETKIDTVYDEQIKEVRKPVFDTILVTRYTTVCRPTCETIMVRQHYKICRPVTTSRLVTEFSVKPYTELIAVPVKTKCGLCGHPGGGCTCKTLARTCYRRVPVVREVVETHMVTEVQSQLVPVVHWRLVPEQRLEQVPVTTCRLVNETVRVRVPRLVFKCVPKTLVYKTAMLTCEEIPITVYRPVVKMVPVVEPSSQLTPSLQSQPGTFETKVDLASPQSSTLSRGTLEQKP